MFCFGAAEAQVSVVKYADTKVLVLRQIVVPNW